MQYRQRKLQRSVTEMRRSCMLRPRVSSSGPAAPPGAVIAARTSASRPCWEAPTRRSEMGMIEAMRNPAARDAQNGCDAWYQTAPVVVYDRRPVARSSCLRIDSEFPCCVPRVLVAVTLLRTPLASRWASERWEAVAVLPLTEATAVAETPAASSSDGGARWRYEAFAVELHRSEAEGYHLNITAPLPKVFVMLACRGGRRATRRCGPCS